MRLISWALQSGSEQVHMYVPKKFKNQFFVMGRYTVGYSIPNPKYNILLSRTHYTHQI
jgi:hypothetical protein